MAPATRYRQLPDRARSIGFELETPGEVEVQPGEAVVRVLEERDGKPIGELEIEVFQAALLIDRDGILEEKVHEAARAKLPGGRVAPAIPVELPNGSGFRADAEPARPAGSRPAFPYVCVFAIASNDLGVDGGVLVTVRCAMPEWPAADSILKTLRVLGRRGRTANDGPPTPPMLPVVGNKRED